MRLIQATFLPILSCNHLLSFWFTATVSGLAYVAHAFHPFPRQYTVSSLITQAELAGIFCRLSIWAQMLSTLQLIICCDMFAEFYFTKSCAQHDEVTQASRSTLGSFIQVPPRGMPKPV